jgi:hypothetical protein
MPEREFHGLDHGILGGHTPEWLQGVREDPIIAGPRQAQPVEKGAATAAPEPERKVEPAKPVLVPKDAPSEHLATVEKGLLKLSVGDKNFDEALSWTTYKTIDLKAPPNMTLSHSVDANGYFFELRDRGTGAAVDGRRHYYPANAAGVCLNDGGITNLERQRLSSNEAAANQSIKNEIALHPAQAALYPPDMPYFHNIDADTAKTSMTVNQFAAQLSDVSAFALAVQEKTLRESAGAYPENPYFKLYLADAYTGEALRPITEQIRAGVPVVMDKTLTLQALDKAIDVLNTVESQSLVGATPQGNVTEKLHPYEVFDHQTEANRNLFYTGAYDQGKRRLDTLKQLEIMVRSGSLPRELAKVVPRDY